MALFSLRRKPKYYTLRNGFKIAPAFDPERFEDSLTYKAEPGDVFVCTYPKCGTTWVQYIVYLLLKKGKPLKQDQSLLSVVPHLEDDGKEAVLNLPKPRIIKSHLPYHMLPKNKNAKYIFVVRNPKDCCVSLFCHAKNFSAYDFTDGNFDDFFEAFIAGEVNYGDYFDHLLSYLPLKNEPNVLFLLYEDMKLNARECIRKIGQFLGEPFYESTENPAILEKFLQNSEFKTMKAIPSVWFKEWSNFIRAGKIGDWRNHFTEGQIKKMDIKFYEKLGGTEAEHFWDEYEY